jgi:hypothetical protein
MEVVKDFPGNDRAVMSSHRFSTISLGFPTNRRHLPHPFLPSLNAASIRLCIASMNEQSTIRQSPGAFIANPFYRAAQHQLKNKPPDRIAALPSVRTASPLVISADLFAVPAITNHPSNQPTPWGEAMLETIWCVLRMKLALLRYRLAISTSCAKGDHSHGVQHQLKNAFSHP